MMIERSIPIACRIPICFLRYTVLMKITMKMTTTAMTRLTIVLMTLMMSKLPTMDFRKSADLSCHVQILSWIPYCISVMRMASSLPVVCVRTRIWFAVSVIPSTDSSSVLVMKALESTLNEPDAMIPLMRYCRVTPLLKVTSTVFPTSTPPVSYTHLRAHETDSYLV